MENPTQTPGRGCAPTGAAGAPGCLGLEHLKSCFVLKKKWIWDSWANLLCFSVNGDLWSRGMIFVVYNNGRGQILWLLRGNITNLSYN